MKHNRTVFQNEGRIYAFFSKYRFLVRLIAIGILVVFMVTLSSTFLISSKSYQHLQGVTDSVFANVADSVSQSLESYISQFKAIGRYCFATPYTYEQYVQQNPEGYTYDQTKGPSAMDMLHGYSISLPLVSGISLYFNKSGKILSSYKNNSYLSNWGPIQQYCRIVVPEVNSSAFLATISKVTEGEFFADNALLEEGRILYLLPVSIRPGVESRRVLIFDISGNSIADNFSASLNSTYTVETLSYRGQLIYDTGNTDGTFHRFDYSAPNGFSVTLSVPESFYRATLDSYSASILRLGVISAAMCMLLIAFLIIYSYRPLNEIVRQTGRENAATDEIAAVKGFISHKEQLENELRNELENEKEMARLKSIEMLLLGLPFDSAASDIFTDAFPCHFVAVAPLQSFPTVNRTLETLKTRSNIVAFEQYRTGYLAMIIGTADEAGREESMKQLPFLLGDGVSFGAGEICRDAYGLHHSYLSAILELNNRQGAGNQPADMLEQMDFSLFRVQVISNDLSCIRSAQELFDKTEVLLPSFLMYWHTNLQTIEKIYSILREYGYQVNDNDVIRYTGMQDVKVIRTSFIESLRTTIATGPSKEAKNEAELADAIIEFIQDNMSNELFGITDLTETFNLSEYTVSKLVQSKTNTYFKKYLSMIRMEAAKEYLESGNDNIQDIAQHCGFSSSSYFIRVFRNETGVTPLQYRNSLRNR